MIKTGNYSYATFECDVIQLNDKTVHFYVKNNLEKSYYRKYESRDRAHQVYNQASSHMNQMILRRDYSNQVDEPYNELFGVSIYEVPEK